MTLTLVGTEHPILSKFHYDSVKKMKGSKFSFSLCIIPIANVYRLTIIPVI